MPIVQSMVFMVFQEPVQEYHYSRFHQANMILHDEDNNDE